MENVHIVPTLFIQRHLIKHILIKKYHIKEFINCPSTHVIYILRCRWGLMHVGQTNRNLKWRVAEHKSAICNGNMVYAISRKIMGLILWSFKVPGYWQSKTQSERGELVQTTLKKRSVLDAWTKHTWTSWTQWDIWFELLYNNHKSSLFVSSCRWFGLIGKDEPPFSCPATHPPF